MSKDKVVFALKVAFAVLTAVAVVSGEAAKYVGEALKFLQ